MGGPLNPLGTSQPEEAQGGPRAPGPSMQPWYLGEGVLNLHSNPYEQGCSPPPLQSLQRLLVRNHNFIKHDKRQYTREEFEKIAVTQIHNYEERKYLIARWFRAKDSKRMTKDEIEPYRKACAKTIAAGVAGAKPVTVFAPTERYAPAVPVKASTAPWAARRACPTAGAARLLSCWKGVGTFGLVNEGRLLTRRGSSACSKTRP